MHYTAQSTTTTSDSINNIIMIKTQYRSAKYNTLVYTGYNSTICQYNNDAVY